MMIDPLMSNLPDTRWRLEEAIDVRFRDLRIFYAEQCDLIERRRMFFGRGPMMIRAKA